MYLKLLYNMATLYFLILQLNFKRLIIYLNKYLNFTHRGLFFCFETSILIKYFLIMLFIILQKKVLESTQMITALIFPLKREKYKIIVEMCD